MERLKGHGRPNNNTVGSVNQHYEDLDTGDIWECRIASKYSVTNGPPVGGYVWELRAKGEDIQDGLFGGGGGVTSWNDLTDKPFYEETTVVSEPLNITWDGNTEGLVSVDEVFFKVSDLALTDEQIKSATLTTSNGVSESLGEIWEYLAVTEDYVAMPETAFFARKSGCVFDGMVFPEAGIYFWKTGGRSRFIAIEYYPSNFTTIEPVEQVKTVVHPIDKKYLPDGNTGDVQSDWNQNDSSAADFIKNKPFYEGLQTIVEETTIEPDWSADEGIGFASLNVALNVTFEDGDDVVVVFNGESYQRKYVDRDGYGFWGNPRFVEEYLEDNGDPFCVINEFDNVIILVNTSAPYTISIHKHAVVYIDSKFIPDDVPKYGTAGELTRIEWDGNTDGLESFVYNAFNYYKVSDIVIPFTHISKLECKRKDNNVVFKRVYQGTNCYSADLIICVTVPGECEIDEGKKFNAPSAGVYFVKNKYTTGWDWCRYLEIDTRRDNTILYLTNPSGVKYAITVDDNGTLTATEVT